MIDPFSPLTEIGALLFVIAVMGCFIWLVVTLFVPKFPRGTLASRLLLLGLAISFAITLVHMSIADYSVMKMFVQFRGWVVLFCYAAINSVIVAPMTLIVGGIGLRSYRWLRRKR